jgi:hypothetical protein
MSDKKFIDGLLVKAPNDNAPEYVKARLSIKRLELLTWLSNQDGEWINADIKVGQSGKWYCSVDDWKPNGASGAHGGTQPQRSAQPQAVSRVSTPAGLQDDEINF